MFCDDIAEFLLAHLLDNAFPHELLLVVVHSPEVIAHIIVVLLFVHLHLRLMPPLGLIHDGRFHWVRILHDPVVLVRLQVRAVKEMLHNLVLALVIGLRHTLLLVIIADLVVRPGQVALLPLLLGLLVAEEALQVVLQLVVHFIALPFDAVRADEGEVR